LITTHSYLTFPSSTCSAVKSCETLTREEREDDETCRCERQDCCHHSKDSSQQSKILETAFQIVFFKLWKVWRWRQRIRQGPCCSSCKRSKFELTMKLLIAYPHFLIMNVTWIISLYAETPFCVFSSIYLTFLFNLAYHLQSKSNISNASFVLDINVMFLLFIRILVSFPSITNRSWFWLLKSR